MAMIPFWKKKWLNALRSGKYRQARGRLRTNNGAMCCLGVLCDIYNPKKWQLHPELDWVISTYDAAGGIDTLEVRLPESWARELRISHKEETTLMSLNDVKQWDFKKIADWIEENL